MGKHQPDKGAGKKREGHTSPPSSTPNERAQKKRGRKGASEQARNPKVGKQKTGAGQSEGLH